MAATMSETLLKKAGEFPTFGFPMISADLFPLKFKQRRRGPFVDFLCGYVAMWLCGSVAM